MRCCYGLAAVSASDARLFTPETSFLRLRSRTVVEPVRIQFGSLKIKAKLTNEMRRGTSFYELLGIPESGTVHEIKKAYKQLARKYHPDVSPPDRVRENTERFIRVQEAYETLSDPRSRALYDTELAFEFRHPFSPRRCNKYAFDEELEEKSKWKNQWQSQLSELERRSVARDADGNLSWAARMRRQRNEFSNQN